MKRGVLGAAILVVLVACGGAASRPRGVTVRFADDATEDTVRARCGEPTTDLATGVAWENCVDGVAVTGAIAPLLGKTLRCELTEKSPMFDVHEDGFTAEVTFVGAKAPAPGLELVFSRSLQNGTDRDGFTGRWAEREALADAIVYRHDVGDATIGGSCDGSTVKALVETLTVSAKALVLRADWRCGVSSKAFRELRCAMP